MNYLDILYTKYKLKNGLEVILHQNKSLPLTAVNIWYKVGSSNETEGKTGIAHLFEHMMFQGSQNVPKEKHFKYIQEAGGSLNGSTSFDRTNYFEKVPSNFIELALWLESDRMGFFLPALTLEKMNNQKDVVKNERLERYDNQPYGLAWEILISNLYPKKHPYSWSTIGSLKDISNYTMEDVTAFFKKYYSPSNASLVIAGDIEIDFVKDLIEKYFSELLSTSNSEKLDPPPALLNENILIERKENVALDRIYLAWHSDIIYGQNDGTLDVLSDILTGSKGSRLYKKLVIEKEIAQDVTAYQFSGKYGGHFMFIATAKPGIKLDILKEEILDELNLIRDKGISQRELTKSINGIKSNYIYSIQNLDAIADQLNAYNYYLNEPNSFSYDLNRYEKVGNEDLKKIIGKYFSKPFVELRILSNSK